MMITSQVQAIVLASGVALGFYGVFLFLIFSVLRTRRFLADRWKQFGAASMRRWEEQKLSKIDERRMSSLQNRNTLKELLAHPGLSLKPIEYLLYRSDAFPNITTHIIAQGLGITLFTDLILITLHLSLMNSFLLACCISLILHIGYLRFKAGRWQKRFVKIFPISLDIINRGLKSGMTLGRGISVVSEEVEDPVGGEFNYIASQLQLGVKPDFALTEAAARIGVDEFRFFAVALVIQREMGGNLAEVLGKLSDVIREREHFRQKVWSMSAEGRTTAVIVGIIPFFMAAAIEFFNPGYLNFFTTDPKGRMMMWSSCILTIVGFVLVLKMMKVEA